MIELGAWTPDASDGWWALYFNSQGSAVIFSGQRNGQGADYAAAPIAWHAGQWHLIALSYSAEVSELYLDGALAARGAGVRYWPDEKLALQQGFFVGSDSSGSNLAQGQFDELATFAEPLLPSAVAAYYQALLPTVQLGPITEAEEAQRLAWLQAVRDAAASGMFSQLDEGDPPPAPPCDGVTLLATLVTNGHVNLSIDCREPGMVYDLFAATNLLNSGTYWAWIAEWPTNQNDFPVTNATEALRFFRLRQIPDLDGDGLRDFLYPEQQGLGFVLDADNDNDGIPNTIEAASGSETNNPFSLPLPSLYVSASAPSGGDGSEALPFRNLRSALNAATNYSVIQVLPGVYSGANNRNLSFGGKKLMLISQQGWEKTLLDCGDAVTNRAFVFTNAEDYASSVIGFTLSNAANSAVYCGPGTGPTFVDCAFVRNNDASGGGGALYCSNASPALLNCRFIENLASGGGGAIYAYGANSTCRIAHCTFSDNFQAFYLSQIYLTNSAHLTMNNCIVWSAAASLGPEIVLAGGATADVQYSDVRSGIAGTGNIDAEPVFETGASRRLTATSPCIDTGTGNGLPAFKLWTLTDMDGEARSPRQGSTNVAAMTDMGADEFVYRLAFPTVQQTKWVLGTNGLYEGVTISVSEVDEASGVAYLGTNATGPLIAIVDDEDRAGFRIYQLNSDAGAIAQSVPVSTLNPNYSGGAQEIGDMEGLTFDPGTTNLYLITSQTKRNRFRDVDSSPPIVDALVDPPSNDYDRRRAVLVRMHLDSTLKNVTEQAFYESEDVEVPYNTGHNATNGLAAFLQQQLTSKPALGQTNLGNRVLLAWNTVNKFGTPSNEVHYPAGTSLPYTRGGTNTTAGTSLGRFNPGGPLGTNTHTGVTPGSVYYYKVWAVDARTNYYEGPTAVVTNNAVPRAFINEFDGAGNNETIELYNPSPAPLSIAGCWLSDGGNFHVFPSGTTIPGRGVWTVNSSAWGNGWHFDDDGHEPIVLARTGATLDTWNMGPQQGGTNRINEGRVWDGGPRGFVTLDPDDEFRSCKYRSLPLSPYPTNIGALNLSQAHKFLDAVPDVDQTKVYLVWQNIGVLPPVWRYSPKQHDFHAMNIEDLAYRSANEMILGLRAPLSNRTNGNAYYFKVTDVGAFLGGPWPPAAQMQGIAGPLEMDLGGLGIRSIKWCPQLGTNGAGRYLVLAGTANGGPIHREQLRQRFSLHAWDGLPGANSVAHPQLLIADLAGYATRPEGVDLINVNGQWRVLFVEDRFLSTGYATRNAAHWPLGILGTVQ